MSLFVVGLVAGIALSSILSWHFLVRPLQKMTENIESYSKDGKFPFSANRKHPELQRLQAALATVLLDLDQYKKSSRQHKVAKQEFLSLVSHELRTPLTSIKGSLNLISTSVLGPISAKAKSFVQIAETEVDRLIKMVNDVLDIAKLESGEMKYEMRWFRPSELLEKVQNSLVGLQQKTGVGVVIDTQASDYEVFADPLRIQQLLVNYVSNAIRHSPEKGLVTTGIDICETGLRFYVIDQGNGLSHDKQKTVFDKFESHHGGTGLGLSICKSISDEHNGEVGVISEEGQGCQFYFILPEYRLGQQKSETAA